MVAPSDVVVVGASAGGVEALRDFVGGLPEDLPAAVLVVLHLSASGVSALPQILSRSGPLRATSARHGAPLEAGHIYTCVPDHHLLVVDSRTALTRGPTENGHRPAVDALFRAAALNWGPRTAGVVLSGVLDDGAAGLAAVKASGGLAFVQDPSEALHRGMPDNATAAVAVDGVARAADMGALLAACFRDPPGDAAPPPPLLDTIEANIAAGNLADSGAGAMVEMTDSSGFTCPDCQGVLFTVEPIRRFRCRVGHAWTAMALLQQQNTEVERSLWAALRALREKEQLAERMSHDASAHGHTGLAQRYRERAVEVRDAARVLNSLLLTEGPAERAAADANGQAGPAA